MSDCVFCDIVQGLAPATVVAAWDDSIAIVPLNPVVEGHILVIPRQHVVNAAIKPQVTGLTFARASELVLRDMPLQACNLITSKGLAATQTVNHLHVHIVPRRQGDGLHLPWTGQNAERKSPRMVGRHVPGFRGPVQW